MNRRHAGQWALGVAGALAAAAGVGVWRWIERPASPGRGGVVAAGAASSTAPEAAAAGPTAAAAPGGDGGAAGTPLQAFWGMRFIQPDGQLLEMASLRGAPLVVNFWATWCPPCLEEMPEIDRFAREFAPRGVRVVGLAVDNPSAVRSYLARTPVGYAIGMAGFDGSELARQLGNGTGGLPFTVAFDRKGGLVRQRLGVTRRDELVAWVQALL